MGKITETHENGSVILRYELESGDELDTVAADKLGKEPIPGVASTTIIEENGKKVIIALANDYPNLVTFSKTEHNKEDILRLMDGLIRSFSIGPRGIPISYILKDPDKIFVDPKTLDVVCAVFPVQCGPIAIKDISDFFRNTFSILRFSPDDKDNYVARILNEINNINFSLLAFTNVIKDMLGEIKKESVDESAGDADANVKVNRMELMRNRAQNQSDEPQQSLQQNMMPGAQPVRPMQQPQPGFGGMQQPAQPVQPNQTQPALGGFPGAQPVRPIQQPQPGFGGMQQPAQPVQPAQQNQSQSALGGFPGAQPVRPMQQPQPGLGGMSQPVQPVQPAQSNQPQSALGGFPGAQPVQPMQQSQPVQPAQPNQPQPALGGFPGAQPVRPMQQAQPTLGGLQQPIQPAQPQAAPEGMKQEPQQNAVSEGVKDEAEKKETPVAAKEENKEPAKVESLTGKDIDDIFGSMESFEVEAYPLGKPEEKKSENIDQYVAMNAETSGQENAPKQEVNAAAPETKNEAEAPKATEEKPVNKPQASAGGSNPFEDIMNEMSSLGFRDEGGDVIEKIPSQMLRKPRTTAVSMDSSMPPALMEMAEKIEAEKKARREAAAAAAAAQVASEGGAAFPQQETVTSLVRDNAVQGVKIVPRFIRTKTGENIYITKPQFIIGKSKLHADYAIENNTAVSREHCIIERELSGANYILDNNSTNGTYVNGMKLEAGRAQLLTDGTKVRLGDEEFIFRLRSGE
ncbi:FHA domain-containing protein [Eubacterium ruminantium]|uniref:FHA domain-containing protein n=1 Tax=Eubacterium ruminantium TaxID=42322 RepID=UPI001568E5DB|nr:FHA domain-containing protein [Eubacterium ruminantium]